MERDRKIEAAIFDLLGRRHEGATICPSDVARALDDDWRPLMQPVRDVAAQLVDRGALEVTQGGRVVDVRSARGPVRLRFPQT